jgi:hypothetical protein
MKVLNLRCAHGHGFEGWFDSEDDFLAQNGNGRIECPLCADRVITRGLSAPRLNLSGAREVVPVGSLEAGKPAAAPSAEVSITRNSPAVADLQAAWLGAVRKLMSDTEDVGERFAEEARRIHYGEAAERPIRGQADAQEREALRDEGIEVLALPVPSALKGPVQ